MFTINLSNVAGYAEIQRAIIAKAQDQASVAMMNNDLVYMEALRADTIAGLDFTIECIEKKYDYYTWFAGSNYISRTSKIVALDTSGELIAIFNRMETLDAHAYYEADVLPVMATPISILLQGRAEILETLDDAIEYMRSKRK
jgi:hypothetical protein